MAETLLGMKYEAMAALWLYVLKCQGEREDFPSPSFKTI